MKIFAEDKIDNTSESVPSLTLGEAIQLAKKAKELFYKKEYNSAISIYKQIITAYPDKIEFYDGYAKVLNAQQKSLEVAELYKEGLAKNEENPYFMHRLSLSIRTICMGSDKAANEFITNCHSSNTLFVSAVLLMFDAIDRTPTNKGFYYDLRDFVKISTARKHIKELHLSEDLSNQILSLTSPIEKKWEKSREPKTTAVVISAPIQGFTLFSGVNSEPQNAGTVVSESDIEVLIQKIQNKRRRPLYNEKENREREKAIKKEKKSYWGKALNTNIQANKLSKAERFGMLILGENINDTDTIGKLRKLYKRNEDYDRLISLNRYLYINRNNVQNALALALSLARYGNEKSCAEAEEILNTIQHPHALLPVYTLSYYLASAYAKINSRSSNAARATLLDGLRFFGNSGLSYSLIECYALSYNSINISKGIDIFKALSGKDVKMTSDAIWEYVKNYTAQRDKKEVNNEEKLRPLYALAKMQKNKDKSAYALTIAEIEQLKSRLLNLILRYNFQF